MSNAVKIGLPSKQFRIFQGIIAAIEIVEVPNAVQAPDTFPQVFADLLLAILVDKTSAINFDGIEVIK